MCQPEQCPNQHTPTPTTTTNSFNRTCFKRYCSNLFLFFIVCLCFLFYFNKKIIIKKVFGVELSTKTSVFFSFHSLPVPPFFYFYFILFRLHLLSSSSRNKRHSSCQKFVAPPICCRRTHCDTISFLHFTFRSKCSAASLFGVFCFEQKEEETFFFNLQTGESVVVVHFRELEPL